MNSQIQLQQQSMALMQNQFASFNKFSLAQTFMELQIDMEERSDKKNNLVLFNLAEAGSEDKPDLEVVKDAFTAAGADPEVVTSVDRLGQTRTAPDANPRPIKIYTTSFSEKLKLLQNQKAVFKSVPDLVKRTNNAFIRPDQSRLERQQAFQLRQQLREVRAKNPAVTFKIKGTQIITENPNAPMQMNGV